MRPGLVPSQLRPDVWSVRRWAVVTLASAAALALAAAAVRGHHEHHLVRKEDLQLPPAVDAKPLRDDLRPVRRCDFATGWPAASATSAAFALAAATVVLASISVSALDAAGLSAGRDSLLAQLLGE